MNHKLVIRGSREKFIWLLIFGVCFLILGYWALVEQHMWFLGGVTIAFAVFGLVVISLMMRPGSTYLSLDSTGFEFVAMRRHYRYAWSDVEAFRVCSVSGAEAVGIRFSASCQSQRVGRAIAEQVAGIEGAISNVLEATPTQVCNALNEWKARYE